MASIRIVDVTDREAFGRIPPCADPGFDHRTCDYWEDEQRGSKAARRAWLAPAAPRAGPRELASARASNPFAAAAPGPTFNPFDPRSSSGARRSPFDPFAEEADVEHADDAARSAATRNAGNPFAPQPKRGPAVPLDAPRKLQLLARGMTVFGTYAKVLELDGEPAAYCQFGPLSAYPRAQRVRDLYRQLPSAPLPAVITCIASTAAARGKGLARRLVLDVAGDLASRGFAAVEAYPEPGMHPDATSAATPAFWIGCGFAVAVEDERFPVVRREL